MAGGAGILGNIMGMLGGAGSMLGAGSMGGLGALGSLGSVLGAGSMGGLGALGSLGSLGSLLGGSGGVNQDQLAMLMKMMSAQSATAAAAGPANQAAEDIIDIAPISADAATGDDSGADAAAQSTAQDAAQATSTAGAAADDRHSSSKRGKGIDQQQLFSVLGMLGQLNNRGAAANNQAAAQTQPQTVSYSADNTAQSEENSCDQGMMSDYWACAQCTHPCARRVEMLSFEEVVSLAYEFGYQ